jgi:hypothetical protein
MTNEELFKAAKDAVDRYLGDTSVDKRVTLKGAEELCSDLEIACEAMEHEIDDEDYEAQANPDTDTDEGED